MQLPQFSARLAIRGTKHDARSIEILTHRKYDNPASVAIVKTPKPDVLILLSGPNRTDQLSTQEITVLSRRPFPAQYVYDLVYSKIINLNANTTYQSKV